MESRRFQRVDLQRVETPCHIIYEEFIEDNLNILKKVKENTGCKILLALKGFAMWKTFPLLSKYLDGVCASGLYEARLGKEEFKKEVHTFCPAFTDKDFDEIAKISNHIVFNSLSQLDKFKNKAKNMGIRVNPEVSVARYSSIYDPSAKNSRLGIRINELEGKNIDKISGLHFHALCENNADAFEKVLKAFQEKFDKYIKQVRWINFGGGHMITAKDYDVDKLCRLINGFKNKYPNLKEVYLEPGEAVVLNAGIFISTVVDIVHKNIAVLDTSVEAHFPDILVTRHESAPYIPEVLGTGKGKHKYTLAGASCAAGDVFSEYGFDEELKAGDKVIFLDTAHYSMVKTNTFNGMKLPNIYLIDKKGKLSLVKEFGYKDFKERLS